MSDTQKKRYFIPRNGFQRGEKYIEVIGPDVFIVFQDTNNTRVQEPGIKVGFIEERVRAGVWTEHDTPPDGTLPELVDRTELWAVTKGITANSTPAKQFAKMDEEVSELYDEIDKDEIDLEATKLEAGDVAVTLIITCQLLGIPFLEALRAAVLKIESRSGKMVDGTWVKDTVVDGDFTPDE